MDWTARVQLLGGAETSFFTTTSSPVLGPTQPAYPMGTRGK